VSIRADAWLLAGLALIVVLALALRLTALAEKPLHHDEGVNGWLSLRLFWWNLFHYGPTDYHGPWLYYANLVSFWLLGPGEPSLRLASALAGGLLPLMLYPARRLLGSAGVLTAGLLLATAPGLVYFSRTCIHEIHLVLFSALWAVGLLRFAGKPGVGWMLLAAGAAAGCFVTKETAVITGASLAVGATLGWGLGRSRDVGAGGDDPDLFAGRTRAEAIRAWTLEAWRAWALGTLFFALSIALFYSSFFSHWSGVADFFEAYRHWIGYGTSGRNQGKHFGYFWTVMASTQGLARWAALPAALLALILRHRLGVTLAGWAAGAFLIYSLIPYKTPWCVLQIDLPVFLLIGWASGLTWRVARSPGSPRFVRVLAGIGMAGWLAAAPGLLARSLEDNRERYDDFRRPYVYYQTYREYHEMLRDLLGTADAMPHADGLGPRVLNVGQEFPLSWYMLTRGWEDGRTQYLEAEPTQEQVERADLVVSDSRHEAAIDALADASASAWHKERYFVRPGIFGFVWYRQEPWERFEAAGGRAASPWPRSPSRPVPPPAAGPR
jgi:uncharacterized protein (TIGR03663 family)